MKKEEKKDGSGTKAVALGASLASLAATAYFFLGPEGKKNQKYAKSWAIKMKGDVVEKLEKARQITQPAYHEIIDSVAAKNEKIMKASTKEIKELASELKKHWQVISNTATAPIIKKKVVTKKIVVTKKPSKTKK